MQNLTLNQKLWIAGIGGFVVGALAVVIWNVSQVPASVGESNTSGEELTSVVVEEGTDTDSDSAGAVSPAGDQQEGGDVATQVPQNGVSVSVTNQPAGAQVAIESVVLKNPGWIVVREMRDGAVGNALGAAWYPAGAHSGSIELLRGTVAGQTYVVVLYEDNGNKAFELSADTLLKGVQAVFTAQ